MKKLLLLLQLLCTVTFATDVTKFTCQPIFEFIRAVDGGHPIYEIQAPIKDLDTLLPKSLTAFANNKPTLKNKIRQNVIFNPIVVNAVRWGLTGRSETKDAGDLLKEIPPNIKYNYVIYGPENDKEGGIVIGRVEVKIPKVDDILSKHRVLAGKHKDVRYSGEFWKDENGVIHFSNNSGTYQPLSTYIENGSVENVLRQLFPSPDFKFQGHPVDAHAIKEAENKKKASKIDKILDKVETISHLDAAFPIQQYYNSVIKKTAKEKRIIRVPVKDLYNIIKMDNVKRAENEERATRIQAAKEDIAKAGGLTREIQTKLFTEGDPMSVVKDKNGKYIAFDGNGRLQSLEMVYGKDSDVEVEVEYYENPSESATNFVTWVRKWRRLDE